jgi:hypothetical protein
VVHGLRNGAKHGGDAGMPGARRIPKCDRGTSRIDRYQSVIDVRCELAQTPAGCRDERFDLTRASPSLLTDVCGSSAMRSCQ